MSAAGDGQKLSACSAEEALHAFLEARGLGTFARRILEETDAESIEDLKLVDVAMLDEVIQAVGLKAVSAKKLRLAIAEIHGEDATACASPSMDAAEPGEPGGEGLGDSSIIATKEAAAAVAHAAEATAAPRIQEHIVVCIDRSGSMGAPFNEVTLEVVKGATRDAVNQRTRMEAVKAMFYAFRDRVDSIGRGTHQMGLVQFDSQVDRLLDLTPQLDRFEAIVDDMEKRGATAIYSSIVEAVSMLRVHFEQDGQADLRILVLTDGQNNGGVSAEEALHAAASIGAVVDAIIVGDRPDANLRKIVSATGGECFQINDLGEGFELLEAESVVSLKARRGGAEKPPFKPPSRVDFGTLAEKTMTQGAQVKAAATVPPDLAKKAVVSIDKLAESGAVEAGLGLAAANGRSAASAKRLVMELQKVSQGDLSVWYHSGSGIHIFPAGDDLGFWRALMEGPSGIPFEGGVFLLNVVIPPNYPMVPPKISFETPVYHCNVSDSGKICLDLLQESWTPAMTIPKALEAIRILLAKPDTDNALRQWIAEITLAHQQHGDADVRYVEKAREATARDAAKGVEEWKQSWGC